MTDRNYALEYRQKLQRERRVADSIEAIRERTDMTVVERVARASYERRRQIHWEGGEEIPAWESLDHSARWIEIDCMRSGLQAAREPSSAMVEAGISKADDCIDSDWDSGGDGESYNSYERLRSDAAQQIYVAMIDKALEE